jgi:hypothetical protein
MGAVLTKEKHCVVDGIELDDADYREAKKKLRNVYKLNVETDDLSVLKDKYDYIYFGDVIEHLVFPAATLKRIKKYLQPNGQVIFSIPNMSHLSVRMMLLKGDFAYGETGLLDKTHLHFYNSKEVARVFGEGGFEVTHFDPVLKDWPEELVKEALSEVGLTFKPAFLKFARKSEASIYQFVGAASPTSQKPKHLRLDVSSPVDTFQELLDQTREYYEAKIASQQEHIKKLDKEYRTALEILHQNENKGLTQRIKSRLKRAGNKQKP